MFQIKSTNNPVDDETQDDTQKSSSTYFSQHVSTITVRKRTQRAVANRAPTKKDSNSLDIFEKFLGCYIIPIFRIYS